MPSILTHPVVPLAAAVALGGTVVSRRLVAAGCVAAIVADLDVLAFALGIPYASPFGHRGFTHSVAFALLLAAAAAFYARKLTGSPRTVFAFIFLAAVSHPLLDACTNGGLGIALAWPFSGARVFAPWRPLEVSPIGLHRFVSPWGARVLLSEFVWIWCPAAIITLAACALGKTTRR